MRKKCANPACPNHYEPSRATRAHEPYCSAVCHAEAVMSQPVPVFTPHLLLPPQGGQPKRQQYPRQHGKDRREVTKRD